MKPMRLFACVLLSIVCLSCEPPEVQPYYGCAPRAGLQMLAYWQAHCLPTPLATARPEEVEYRLAVAMGTSSGGQTSVHMIGPGLCEVCPGLSAWLCIADTVAYWQNELPYILVRHDADHVEFVETRPDTLPSGMWSIVVVEPNWI